MREECRVGRAARASARRAAGRAAPMAALQFSPPVPRWAAFSAGRAGPLARTSREIASRSPQSGSTVARHRRALSATHSPSRASVRIRIRASDTRKTRGENSELVVRSWPSLGRDRSQGNPVRGARSAMLPALALLLLVLAPAGPVAARRHAPDLREDEPARRTTRPAGECTQPGHLIPTACGIEL